jgi:hypothetical protein
LEIKMTENVESNENNEPQLTEIELRAQEAGWVPKEEYLKRPDAEEHKWVEAGEFLRRGELFKKIEDQNKQLKDVKNALAELKKLHGQVKEVEYKRALETLREQKKAALVDGDADAVIAVDDKIAAVREQMLEEKKAPAQDVNDGSEHPQFVAWKDRNNWYNTSEPMRAYADTLGVRLARSGMSQEEVLRQVEIEVKKEFPHKFQNPNQRRAGTVEAGDNRSTPTSKFQLTAEERKTMNTFVRTGVMTEKEYIEKLKEVQG